MRSNAGLSKLSGNAEGEARKFKATADVAILSSRRFALNPGLKRQWRDRFDTVRFGANDVCVAAGVRDLGAIFINLDFQGTVPKDPGDAQGFPECAALNCFKSSSDLLDVRMYLRKANPLTALISWTGRVDDHLESIREKTGKVYGKLSVAATGTKRVRRASPNQRAGSPCSPGCARARP